MTQVIIENGLDIKAIAPRRGDKYSPNLYKWLTDPKRRYRASESLVYRDKDGLEWIGRLDGDAIIGERLIATLCQGRSAFSKFWLGVSGLVEVKDFWQRYTQKGRCAIDTNHEMHFIGDEGRWQQSGDSRTCLWCGHQQSLIRWTETVERQEWQNKK